uniref:Uncharacterized protein n=1 Tax=Pyxicephalus adspersus TaxID=30357 RepID=A0AAV3A6K7_PYXAD|nr:TPA: hypothetical protein GDO54_015724 [Pyxicephalus adspersus]
MINSPVASQAFYNYTVNLAIRILLPYVTHFCYKDYALYYYFLTNRLCGKACGMLEPSDPLLYSRLANTSQMFVPQGLPVDSVGTFFFLHPNS